ncbi:zinc finger protein 883-like [Elgaria multicarinata webbii]|uniref:zinc finger protein 883-like n=1 Tax=Elgaria multicarinata webbii TaxID=159646 RepID=UPI002FCD3E53
MDMRLQTVETGAPSPPGILCQAPALPDGLPDTDEFTSPQKCGRGVSPIPLQPGHDPSHVRHTAEDALWRRRTAALPAMYLPTGWPGPVATAIRLVTVAAAAHGLSHHADPIHRAAPIHLHLRHLTHASWLPLLLHSSASSRGLIAAIYHARSQLGQKSHEMSWAGKDGRPAGEKAYQCNRGLGTPIILGEFAEVAESSSIPDVEPWCPETKQKDEDAETRSLDAVQESEDKREHLSTSQGGIKGGLFEEDLSNPERSRRKEGNYTKEKDKSISTQSGVHLEQEEQTGEGHRKHLDAHLRIHTAEKPSQSSQYVKRDCLSQPTVKGPVLDTEGKSHTGLECTMSFTRSSQLTRHHQQIHSEELYMCTQCGNSFHKKDLKAHQRCHRTWKPFKCSWCEKSYGHSSNLTRHERVHTGEKPYECAECGKACRDNSHLITHQRMHTGEKPYACKVCGKSFSYSSSLIMHERIHTGEKPFQCSTCAKCFKTNSDLSSHERIHTGEKPYTCKECGRSFSQRVNLITHERIHTGEKPYICKECEKSFSHSSSLIRHERIHTGEKPYTCKECGKSFSHSSSLIRHEKIHTGEKACICKECGRSFSQRANLITHERIHTGEKPYKCAECEKGFSDNSQLTKHQRIHTGEKPYTCKECGNSFSQRAILIAHERIHTGEKPYKCSICSETFRYSYQLARHQRTHAQETP